MCPASLEPGQVWRGGVCDEVLLVVEGVAFPSPCWRCYDMAGGRFHLVSDARVLEILRYVRLL